MSTYTRAALQQYISSAYKESDMYISCAIQKLDAMVDAVEALNPTSPEDLEISVLITLEEFANDSSSSK